MSRPTPATRSIVALFGATVLCLAPWGSAQAIRAADVPPPTPEAVRAANPPAAQGVLQGDVTAVDAAGERVAIDGVWWRLVDGRTRVYRQGKAASAAVLAKGQRVSYSAAAEKTTLGATLGATLGVVYVQ